jgi:hypothetical protein
MLPVETQAEKAAYTYNISSNGAASDWYWEVTSRGEIIARGLAATQTLARVDARKAVASHVDPNAARPRSEVDAATRSPASSYL